MGAIRNIELKVFTRLGRSAPAGLLGRLALWLLAITLLAALSGLLPGLAGSLFHLLSLFSATALLVVLVPLLWRFTLGRFLWKVRNRLIVTYVLMALTPVVLFVTLGLIATYIFLGQFSIFVASNELDRSLQQMTLTNRGYVTYLTHSHALELPGEPQRPRQFLPEPDRTVEPRPRQKSAAADTNENQDIFVFVDGKPAKHPLEKPAKGVKIESVPGWLPESFHGVVLDGGRLYLRAVDRDQKGPFIITTITSMPLVSSSVSEFAESLGRVTVVPDISFGRDADADLEKPISSEAEQQHADAVRPNTVVGGTLPAARHFYDLPVNFYAPLHTMGWQTGAKLESGVHVTSRPTLLYDKLFSTSLQVGAYVQDVLIGLAIFFGVLELIAFLMAMRLNQTITASVSSLYGATLAIDQGNFDHRIQVTRKDQLAALSQSFNTMAASLERLLIEQREKERLEGELEIAHEVQANLFPSGHVSLPTLEVHGFCQPARTVSGDYYDFLISGNSELSLALGDISGKGISAALLMATLHSAVRAYRFAGDDMRAAEGAGRARGADDDGGVMTLLDETPLLAASFAEPAQILGLLNRHLYRSTQPEKYATLFLAHYDGRTSDLIYSTGGQLPPLLLRTDDSVARLDCGGTVIGLMDNMQYEQGTEHMNPGDILIAYSDGVTEPENDFGDFGEDRLLDVVRRHRKLPLDQIADQVMQALRAWIGASEQPDDITLVLARQR